MLGAGGKAESAVSPVVGVMLLLVIVIILAALVAAFAGGAVDGKEHVPSVDLAVYTAGKGDGDFRLIFEHRGGDPLGVGSLKVNTWVHLPGGDLCPASHGGRELEGLFGTADYEAGETTIWKAGEIRNTTNLTTTAGFLNLDKKELSDNITQSTVVDVAIYHLPSGALLHKSSLSLKER